MAERMVMRRMREGEVPPDGATALQDDPRRPVFRANGPYDYVCVECGNVLAASMGLEQMTKRVRVKSRDTCGQGYANADVVFSLSNGGGTIHTAAQISG